MKHSVELLYLLEKRLQLQKELKELLLKQQHTLVQNQAKELNDVTGEQLMLLETIFSVEQSWQQLLSKYFTAEELANPPIPITQRFELTPAEQGKYRRLHEQLVALVKEVGELRDTNRMLMNHSLNFIRGLFCSIADHADNKAVYHKNQKKTPSNILIDRTL
jgi:ABC-type uncharacterized transport system permease subunit